MTQSNQSVVLINGFGVLFVILNSFGLGLRLPVGNLLAQAAAHWKITLWALVINFVVIPLVHDISLWTGVPSNRTMNTRKEVLR